MMKITLPVLFAFTIFILSIRVNAQAINKQDSLALVDLYNNTNGSGWLKHDNWLTTKPVSSWFGITVYVTGRVTQIILPQNKLKGSLPASLGNLTFLAVLDVQYNHLTGTMPQGLNFPSHSDLTELRIDHNYYTFDVLTSLYNIRAGYNRIVAPQDTMLHLPVNATKLTISTRGIPAGFVCKWYNNSTLVASIKGDSTYTPQTAGRYSAQIAEYDWGGVILNTDTANIYVQATKTDSLALVDLYNSTNGANWNNKTNWLTKQPICNWNGITEDKSGKVTAITFYSNSLSGNLPASLGNLTSLITLNLAANGLTGSIPSSFGNLTKLQTLGLEFNSNLGGTLPSSLGNLTSLQTLLLQQDQFTGSLPATLGNMANLQYIDGSNNKFTGGIPATFGNLSNLKYLWLFNNQLSDTLPASLGNLTQLENLQLQTNSITGNLPSSFSKLTKLKVLNVFTNKFTGNIPSFLGTLTNLTTLNIGGGFKISGTIPSSLGNLVNLTNLIIGYTAVTGSIPASFVNLTKLNVLVLSKNHLNSGTIPNNLADGIGSNFYIDHNYFTFNTLENYFAQTHYNSSQVEQDTILNLHLYRTKLSVNAGGTLSNNTYKWFNGSQLVKTVTGDSTFAPLTPGDYRVDITNSLVSNWILHSVTYTINQLPQNTTDSLALIALYTNANGANWLNKTNWFSLNPLNTWYGITTDSLGRVTGINLAGNNLKGAIPAADTNFTNLKALNLANNYLTFTGTNTITKKYPFAIISPQKNIHIIVTQNKLAVSAGGDVTLNTYKWYNGSVLVKNITGDSTYTLPAGGRYSVTVTNSATTKLTLYSDTIAVSIPLQDSLALVDLYNSTNGPAWTYVTGWLKGPLNTWSGISIDSNRCVTSIVLSYRNLRGTLPSSLGNLTNLTRFSVTNNQLTGGIPASFGNMVNLGILELSYNQLSGSIPVALYNLPKLTQLILGSNQLTGSIPAAMGNLKSLQGLYLFNNQLSGTIPGALGKLTLLTSLDLSQNNLSGTIPDSLKYLTGLSELYLGYNQLSGSIPAFLSNLTSLQYIYLENNKLTGAIPSALGSASIIKAFVACNNQLTGDIPLPLCNTPNLYIVINNNNFTFSNLQNVLAKNIFASYTPQNAMPLHYSNLNLSTSAGASPAGNTYYWYKDSTLIRTATGDSTYIPGTSGRYSVKVTNFSVKYLTLYSDTATITITPHIQDSLALVNFYDSTGGPAWVNKTNWLTKPLKNWYGITLDTTGRVTAINLAANNITGTIPASFGNFASLKTLNLANNSLIFNGMEQMAKKYAFAVYQPQHIVNVHFYNGKFAVTAGGTLTNNTYRWFNGATIFNTKAGDSTYTPVSGGRYSVAISNSAAVKLTLFSDTFSLTATQQDSLALVNLYDSANGKNWLNKTSWLTKQPLKTWYGITLDSNNQVNAINLTNNNLTGSIPFAVTNMYGLKTFNLASNALTFNGLEQIATKYSFAIYQPQHTVHLHFSDNKLSVSAGGSIKNNTYKWYNNQQLIKTVNGDSTYTPIAPGNYFVTITNQLAGKLTLYSDSIVINNIAPSISDSLALVDLYNSTNGPHWAKHDGWLTDPVRLWYGVQTTDSGRVVYIFLSHNQLTGTLPSSLGNLSILVGLYVDNNNLTGPMPVSLSTLPNLNGLFAYNNYFNFSGLEELSKKGNIALLTPQLTRLHVNVNNKTLAVSAGGTSANNTYTWYSINTSGQSTFLRSSANDSTYTPVATSKFTVTVYNKVVGLTLNSDTISIPFAGNINDSLVLVTLYNTCNGPGWINHTNWLTKAPISTWFGITTGYDGRVTEINLTNNLLSGNLPAAITNLSNLQRLDLRTNNLTGNIVTGISNLKKLQYLYLASNKLTGPIPAELINITGLLGLEVSHNQLSGLVPVQLLNLQQLNVLYFTDNNFTFSDLEAIAPRLRASQYTPQANLKIHFTNKLLSVNAGGTLGYNTYKWYNGSSLYKTLTGDSTYRPTVAGKYSVSVNNSLATALTLYSDTITLTAAQVNLVHGPGGGKAYVAGAAETALRLYPNPVHNTANIVFISATKTKYLITITDNAGKTVKEINGIAEEGANNIKLNLESLTQGAYTLTLLGENSFKGSITLVKL